jgi:4-amino-4-deoxychorismate lyase
MRGALIEAAVGEGITVRERHLALSELQAADEVFVTNAVIGVWPLVALDALRWNIGPFARRAQHWVSQW